MYAIRVISTTLPLYRVLKSGDDMLGEGGSVSPNYGCDGRRRLPCPYRYRHVDPSGQQSNVAAVHKYSKCQQILSPADLYLKLQR